MMKRLLICLMTAFFTVVLTVSSAFAGPGEIAENNTVGDSSGTDTNSASSEAVQAPIPSQPKLMVTSYYVDTDYLSAGNASVLSVTVHNTSDSQQIRNLKMSFSSGDNEIIPGNIGTTYLKRIKADGWYEWKFEIVALAKAASGVHPATITMEYEDSNGNPCSASDSLALQVRQKVLLTYNEPQLEPRMTQGDTPTFSMNLMNMGKGTIYNVLLTFDLPGIANGGSILVGNIEPGETKTGMTNFRVDSDTLGEVNGKVTLTYEDDFGQRYTKELPLSTTIEEKVEIEPPTEIEDEPKLNTKIILIIAAGSAIVLLIVIILIVRAVKKKREREEDERRL